MYVVIIYWNIIDTKIAKERKSLRRHKRHKTNGIYQQRNKIVHIFIDREFFRD